MKIYTKTGDQGQTSLLGGLRVPKYHVQIEAYGTVDELNAHVGVLRASVPLPDQKLIAHIQSNLFTIGSLLATTPRAREQMKIPQLAAESVQELEHAIDRLNAELPELRSFILPGSTALNAQCHIARTVCRRAERRVVELRDQDPDFSSELVVYLNRLSDYLFMLARKLTAVAGESDIEWKGV